jgi:sensor domain CHASE-containing protein
MNVTGQLTVLIISLLVAIAFFILIREIVCWYYKINERNEILREQNEILKNIYKEMKNKEVESN